MTAQLYEATNVSAIHEIIIGRRSIRAFRAQPVPRRLVEELLREAAWAPSPHNSQPWRFTVLFDTRDKEGLADAMADRLAEELRADGLDAAAIASQTERSRRRITLAPVVLLCSLVRDGLASFPDSRRDDLEWQMAVQSVGAVLQTLFLVAASHGLGACWMAAPMYCPDVVRKVLDLPESFVPQALTLMGYPAGPGKIRERRPFGDVVELR